MQREKEEKEKKDAEEKAKKEKIESGEIPEQESNVAEEKANSEDKPIDGDHDKVHILEDSLVDKVRLLLSISA